jgi:hypothetical protein
MSCVPTFWFGSRLGECLLSQPLQRSGRMENSMPSRAQCLSERVKELPDRDSSSLSIDLRP